MLWEEMKGDERTRFCQKCQLHVYNLSEMTRQEAQEFIEQKEGRLCVRMLKRQDGMLMTKDCPHGAFERTKRMWVFGFGVIAASFLGTRLAWIFPEDTLERFRNSKVGQTPTVKSVINHFAPEPPKPAPVYYRVGRLVAPVVTPPHKSTKP